MSFADNLEVLYFVAMPKHVPAFSNYLHKGISMKKKTTMHDIAKELGLSTGAISKALRGHEGISEKTKKLVLDTAIRMNYKGAVEGKAKSASGKVLILTDNRAMTDAHSMSTYFYIERNLKAYGLDVAYHGISTMDWEEGTLDIIRTEDPLGIFLFGRFTHFFVEKLKEAHPTIIVIDHDLPYFSVDTVMVDDYHGALLAVQHLVKNGHHRIGFIGDNRISIGFLARYHGFCDALTHWGLDYYPEYVYDLHFMDKFSNVDFHTLAEHLNYDRLPTAFFCANDPIAFVLNTALNARGIRTPEDVSIVGFDNLEAGQWQSPPLTSIHYPREHIAKQALNALLFRLENSDAPYTKMMVQPDLVVRQSVASPMKAAR